MVVEVEEKRKRETGEQRRGVPRIGSLVERDVEANAGFGDGSRCGARMTSEDDGEQMAKEGGNEQRPVVLTARDRELFVHLAISRYLTSDQIGKLVFPGKTASIAPRRLRRLAAGKH